jgi:beta-N-acetylhexosaminidase
VIAASAPLQFIPVTERGHSFGSRFAMRAAAASLSALMLAAAQPALASPRADSNPTVARAAAVPVSALIGQKLVVAMQGASPSADLLGRISRGEVGGVILFGANIRSAPQLARLARKLREAAAAGSQPPLLITTDQEGGGVKRLPWAPPTLSPPQMGAIGETDTAFSQGRQAGRVLACAAVNGNLAPVADVPASTASFLYQQGRTWSFDSGLTASLSDAFASGLEDGATVPAMKHFPGLGRATENTDLTEVTIRASADSLAPGLRPYRRAIGHGIPMIMLSNATYPAYDRSHAAGWSHAISVGLLRQSLGFTGVSITDSLNGTAKSRGISATTLAIRAARAGTDMILLTGSESATRSAYDALVAETNAGTIPMSRLQASYDRILAMKSAFPAPISDATPPSVHVLAPSLVAGTTMGLGSTLVRASWTADDGCHIAAYSAARQADEGAAVAQTLPSPLTTMLVQSLRVRSRYTYLVSATDGAGNTSDPHAGTTFIPRRVQGDDPAIVYSGGPWTTADDDDASGGSITFSTDHGATASFSFTGYSVAWAAVRGPSHGKASVYVDGTFVGAVDLNAGTHQERQVVFAHRWAHSGPHTLMIVNRGTAGHSHVAVDALLTLAPA